MDRDLFYNMLEHSGYFKSECSNIEFKNEEGFYLALDDIIGNNRKVYLYGDYDWDGMSCLMIMKDLFKSIGFTNFDIHKYWNRTHLIDTKAISNVVNGDYDYMFIMDSGSNELEKLCNLTECGVKVLLVDHHKTFLEYGDYPKDCVVINNVIENRYRYKQNKTPYICSAGSLIYLVMRRYFSLRNLKDDNIDAIKSTSCYALCSLYSDCIDMGNPYNRIIYNEAVSNQEFDIPLLIRSLMNEFQILCKRFIGFTFAPKINAAFRSENFEVLNKILCENVTLMDNHRTTKELLSLHEETRELVTNVTPLVSCEEFDNFVLGNLNSVNSLVNIEENKLYNYTGLIATRIVEKYCKPCVVLCGLNTTLKGSFRDNYGRPYLNFFKNFCHAEGHDSAFGIKLPKFGYKEFRDNLQKLDKDELLIETQKPMVMLWEDEYPDIDLFNQIALYNEFSGKTFPTMYLHIYLSVDMKEYENEFGFSYKWGDIYIKSEERLEYFQNVTVCPTVGARVSLRVIKG